MVYTSVEMVDLECVNNPVPVVRLDQLRSNMAVPVRWDKAEGEKKDVWDYGHTRRLWPLIAQAGDERMINVRYFISIYIYISHTSTYSPVCPATCFQAYREGHY